MKRSGFKNKIQKPMKRSPLKAKKGFSGITYGEYLLTLPIMYKNSFKKAYKNLSPQAEADRLFSLVIRRSHADCFGQVGCATCPAIEHWKNMQCGHFRRRQHLATRYLKENCAPQCEGCNCFKDGEEEKMAYYLNRKYGPDHSKQITDLSNTIVSNFDYKKLIGELKEELKQLVEFQVKDR